MRKGMILLTGLGLLASAGEVRGQDDFEWSGAVAGGESIRILGISGDVRATRSRGGTARIHAEKRGRERDFDDVRIVMEEGPDGVTVCAVYRRPNATDCDSRWNDGDDHDDRRDIRVSVDFDVEVPAGVRFRPSVVSGDIRADGLDSDIEANTVSGDIDVSTSGLVEAQTVSGSIEAVMGSSELRDLEFQTVSGDITIHMPDGVDADLRVSSLSGGFDSDFPIEVTRHRNGWVGSSVRGRLGEGGPRLRFETVSGTVELRRLQ